MPQRNESELLTLSVQEVALAKKQKTFAVSLQAAVKDATAYELHPEWNLDADGSYVSNLSGEDEEERTEHWLWTEAGFGPVKEMMTDSSKQLLLFEASDITIGTVAGPRFCNTSMDSFDGENGTVVTVLECDLGQPEDATWQALIDNLPKPGGDYDEETLDSWLKSYQSSKAWAQEAREALIKATDEGGMTTLYLHYQAMMFPQDFPYSSISGAIAFQVKLN